MAIRRMASIKTPADLRDHAASLGLDLPVDLEVETGPDAPLARPFSRASGPIGNRFAILPMEGWDGLEDGRPSDLTRKRWRNFGRSGAKLIWGGEAVAVRHDGRANPNQLLINEANLPQIAGLLEVLVAAHVERFGRSDDLLIGLQLTHSGRFARPNEKRKPEPRIAYRHPYLDPIVGVQDDRPLLSDDEIARLVEDFIKAARLARKAGFGFVDIKHCHGYLGHEFLSAVDRPGRYGGSLENRGRFLREVVEGVRAEAPGLEIGVRLSVFDLVPFRPGPEGTGEPMGEGPYRHAFGGDGTGLGVDLTEVSAFLSDLESLGIDLLCTTAGSPYYNPHVIRPAAFPPSDGYLPPEDPLVGVVRHIEATAWLKARHPGLAIVGSGYSYLQDWLPNVGQRVVREGGVDFVGLGRMVIAYPEMPADVLAGRPLARKRICRTFSDCTTAPRNGMVSGCYPLDPEYKKLPERERVNQIKQEAAERTGRSDDASDGRRAPRSRTCRIEATADEPFVRVVALAIGCVGLADASVPGPVAEFDFGPGRVEPGYIKVLPSTTYSKELGYGFEPGFKVVGIDRGGESPLRDDYCSGTGPFLFSVALPEGNYNVKLTLGDKTEATTTTIKAESRRLMLEAVRTGATDVHRPTSGRARSRPEAR